LLPLDPHWPFVLTLRVEVEVGAAEETLVLEVGRVLVAEGDEDMRVELELDTLLTLVLEDGDEDERTELDTAVLLTCVLGAEDDDERTELDTAVLLTCVFEAEDIRVELELDAPLTLVLEEGKDWVELDTGVLLAIELEELLADEETALLDRTVDDGDADTVLEATEEDLDALLETDDERDALEEDTVDD